MQVNTYVRTARAGNPKMRPFLLDTSWIISMLPPISVAKFPYSVPGEGPLRQLCVVTFEALRGDWW
jgi:hypothetical protein